LAGNGEVGLGVPVLVIGAEIERVVALTCELDDALDVVLRYGVLLGGLDLALQRRVLGRVVAVVAIALAIDAGLHDGVAMLPDDLGTGDEGGNLLLFLHLPVDEGLD